VSREEPLLANDQLRAPSLERLVAKQELMDLKARYFRLLDTKQWVEWAELFTDDCSMWVEDQPEITYSGRDCFVNAIREVLEDATTVHHGHMPELEFDQISGPLVSARGIWAMTDFIEIPSSPSPVILRGHGHYHETYRREPGERWRISSLRLNRIRVDWDS